MQVNRLVVPRLRGILLPCSERIFIAGDKYLRDVVLPTVRFERVGKESEPIRIRGGLPRKTPHSSRVIRRSPAPDHPRRSYRRGSAMLSRVMIYICETYESGAVCQMLKF
ncbi:hypothetical protein CEXT_230361 [Caerostris extrusa]|uniref:Uncharacterized protein n=1 Tax=Caerostris extrusa TaxID=172846 RepID=A0AAV4U9K3_CAEEX|nr:hypothetical protein CEXT_230361 [Caerostris extrusa]